MTRERIQRPCSVVHKGIGQQGNGGDNPEQHADFEIELGRIGRQLQLAARQLRLPLAGQGVGEPREVLNVCRFIELVEVSHRLYLRGSHVVTAKLDEDPGVPIRVRATGRKREYRSGHQEESDSRDSNRD